MRFINVRRAKEVKERVSKLFIGWDILNLIKKWYDILENNNKWSIHLEMMIIKKNSPSKGYINDYCIN